MSLLGEIEKRARDALLSGALEPIPSRLEIVEDAGVSFTVRVVENLARKPSESKENPFLPYEEALFVADVSDTHVALLNKFNVMPIHLLVVTREYEEQESLLSRADFEAAWRLMQELEGLVFYNAGSLAGASQRHKHLQYVPFPVGEGPEETPLDLWSSQLPFVRAIAKLEPSEGDTLTEGAERAREQYLRLLRSFAPGNSPRPYNLLMTTGWLCVVPRARESWRSISVNALGFAGAFLARSDDELAVIRREGPFSILEHVGIGSVNEIV
ncbi:MAG TPA: phosphorylase [Vicinamibacteria bacterium]|nr:phosphorylase [Vicinamibacteria bacterium]